jgi:hypothetical protein
MRPGQIERRTHDYVRHGITSLIALQIGKPLTFIPEDKIQEILALKRRLGFPDARLPKDAAGEAVAVKDTAEMERLVEQVVARLEGRG